MVYDLGPRLLKLRKDKNLTQKMVVNRAKGSTQIYAFRIQC